MVVICFQWVINLHLYPFRSLQTLATSHDKTSKKSWSQRLKITKNDKQPLSAPDAVDEATRPRSLQYTEPMYFGTIRGDSRPINLANSAQFYAPVATVVLCACSDYLHGTKKDAKKPTLCKKCRGTRVPLAQFGGTVRLHSTAPLMAQPMRSSIGTVRLPPGFNATAGPMYGPGKQRPSILGGGGGESSDPYDMMRRSRLVSPELQPVTNVLKHHHTPTAAADGTTGAKGKGKSRAKSTSPHRERRSRSRTRRSPSPPSLPPASQSHRNGVGGWVTENEANVADVPANVCRRSILHCDPSAYELISKISHNNEFAPMADDDDDIYSMMPMLSATRSMAPLHSPPPDYSTNTNSLDVTALAGQRMNFSPSKAPQNGSAGDRFVYDRIGGYATASDGSSSSSTTGSPKSCGRRHTAPLSPVRPPRGNQRKSTDAPKLSTALDIEPASDPASNGDFMLTSSVLTHISNDLMPHTAQSAIVIKSILKRPSSIASDSQPSSLSVASGSDSDYGRTTHSADTNVRPAKGKVCIALSKNTSHGPVAASATPPSGPASTAAAAAATALSAVTGKPGHMTSLSPTKEKRSSGSHFYLPMPQRKKVQFSVDTNSAASGAVEEAYFGEHDQRHLHDIGGGDGDGGVNSSDPSTTHMFACADDAAAPLVSASAVADLLIGSAAIQQQHHQQQHSNYTVAHVADYAAAAPSSAAALSTHVTGLDTVGSAVGVTFVPVHTAAAATASTTAAVIEIIPPAVGRTSTAGTSFAGDPNTATTMAPSGVDEHAGPGTSNADGNYSDNRKRLETVLRHTFAIQYITMHATMCMHHILHAINWCAQKANPVSQQFRSTNTIPRETTAKGHHIRYLGLTTQHVHTHTLAWCALVRA